tara:strand:+ start:7507 stop:7929 length:423 start_codon:yes stop_codon:yes gene_type:complete
MAVKNTYQEFEAHFTSDEVWDGLDGLDEIDKMWSAYGQAIEDLTGDHESKPVVAFTEEEMKAIFRLVSYAAKCCGGGEDIIGSILYTGAFHFLKDADTGPDEQGRYAVARGNDAIVALAQKIDRYYDDRFDPPQPRNAEN